MRIWRQASRQAQASMLPSLVRQFVLRWHAAVLLLSRHRVMRLGVCIPVAMGPLMTGSLESGRKDALNFRPCS